MIKQIRTSKFSRFMAFYMAIMIFVEMTQPTRMYALTSGPTQPEFNSFTPISTSDMVDLSSGDFNYNIPVMDVGGYPLNLSYNSGVTMDQEASWVGLGWNLNVGQISRQVRGLPDDFRGDQMNYINNLKDNVTVGTNFNLSPAVFGTDFPFSLGLGVQYNNSEGVTFKPSIGVSYELAGGVQVGVDLSSSVGEGASVNPSVSVSKRLDNAECTSTKLTGSIGASLNSRKGLENMTMSASTQTTEKNFHFNDKGEVTKITHDGATTASGSVGGSISFNSQSYTPTKRIGFDNINKTFNATIGGEVFGAEGQVRITGYGSYQKINDEYKNKTVGAYGYENTQYKNNSEGVLDFNREKEQVVNKNTNALPVTNYTYDIYNIEGQGVSGMFRPYRSQVGYLYNDNVSDRGLSGTFGAELGLGNLVHGGLNFDISPSTSTTGLWSDKNYAKSAFVERSTDRNKPLYEQTYFKLVGELGVDNESSIYTDKILKTSPLRIEIGGSEFNRTAKLAYMQKGNVSYQGNSYTRNVISKIKRDSRLLRNQSIQKISNKEADNKFIFANPNAKSHHNAGIKVIQSDGTSYIYGKTVYNTKKVEATFDVTGKNGNNQTGIVDYAGSLTGNGDRYQNIITTPGYAHTYLITSILSSDYEDIDNNGPTDTDLGSYTKFDYTKTGDNAYVSNYRWRTPFERDKASFNEGLKTSQKDQKGNYIYGEKELSYLKKIETKTHIAFFDLEDRKDAMGVLNDRGGIGTQSMKRIKSIRLYSKSELVHDNQGNFSDPGISSIIKPIKTAHFEYDYSLCSNIPSNNGIPESINGVNLNAAKGKLTLKKVFFTYRGSNMGKYTPYVFNYNENSTIDNPNYGMNEFDIWGNYKKTEGPLNNREFPFVKQGNPISAAQNTGAWTLKRISLPSGGEIVVTTESDDYKFVQNKKAMEMFKVVGAGNIPTPSSGSTNLFTGNGHNKYLYVQVAPEDAGIQSQNFIDKYLSENLNKPIYFKFLLKMNSQYSDYVSGYFEIDLNRSTDMVVNTNGLVAIPLKFLRRDGGITGNGQVNPIAKAGWGFGRTYLNRAVYSISGNEENTSFISIVEDLVGSIGAMAEIFRGPNAVLETKGCAKTFNNQSSWIRLENPNGKKLGGGLRVKKIELHDNWDVMNGIQRNNDNSLTATGEIYEESYGQEYSYKLNDESSSGVATFEPNSSPENPFVEPFYGNDGDSYAERIGAPKEINYVEKPFGENFFPSPRITYSKVTVNNINKNGENGLKVIKKHATGKVVTQHYTSYDFPTLVDYTNIDLKYEKTPTVLTMLLDIMSLNHLTASQGFSIETNDMNGKIKSEHVYAEEQSEPISEVIYKYNIDDAGRLNNNLTTIDEKGFISKKNLGIDYDMINDFNESNSVSETFGGNGNLAAFLVGIFPGFVPMILPKYARHETIMRTATTTKVVHKTGILVEKIAHDLGSRVSTKNLAWDAKTGQVLLTQTINEFDDKYYSFNYPAYWYYKGMGMASENLGLTGKLSQTVNAGQSYFFLEGYSPLNTSNDITKFFKIGDELEFPDGTKLWVFAHASNHIKLMNRDGETINQTNIPTDLNFKIIRSGFRNMQMASMASVTCMINPLDRDNNGVTDNAITNETFGYTGTNGQRVVNASAIEYSDIWKSQCENGLPNEDGYINGLTAASTVNPFIYNTKGDWRAIKSYAYLTGRNNFTNSNRRKTGYFNDFSTFYKTNNSIWSIDSTKWTFASQVTRYSPYGVELENKDALKRYSSAQYGYQYKLPVAVASNSRYGEMGFDGFEDYNDLLNPSQYKPHFGFSQGLNSDVSVTNQKSHTGHNSIAVKPGKKAVFKRKIGGCKPICNAKVVAKPSSLIICPGETVNINLTSPFAGTTFAWTAAQSGGLTGALGGSGNVISQTINSISSHTQTITYTITPTHNGCVGEPLNVTITVKPLPEQYGNVTQSISNGTHAIFSFSGQYESVFSWTVQQNGVTGATPGVFSGQALTVNQPVSLTGSGPGTVTYTVTTNVLGCTQTHTHTITFTITP